MFVFVAYVVAAATSIPIVNRFVISFSEIESFLYVYKNRNAYPITLKVFSKRLFNLIKSGAYSNFEYTK